MVQETKPEIEQLKTQATMLELGLDTAAPDFAQAYRLWLKAAEMGDPTSMAKVALYLECGRGVPMNTKVADEWVQRAAEKGFISPHRQVKLARKVKQSDSRVKVLILAAEVSIANEWAATFEELGCPSTVSYNAKECLSMVQKSPDFLYILIDRNMPGVNGFNVVSTFRQVTFSKAPVIALVSDKVTKDDIQSGKQVGVDTWLIKPVKRFSIHRLVEKSMS